MIRSFHTARSAARGRLSTFTGPAWHRARIEPLESRSLLTATVIAVDTFDDVLDPNDGLTSLREAILEANASVGDEEIQLAAGTYALSIQGAAEDAALRGDLDIVNNGSLKILGAGPQATTIDAAGLFNDELGYGDRLFDVQAGAVVELSGLTLTGGDTPLTPVVAERDGGAIRNTGGQVTITDSTLSGNRARWGGGGIGNPSGTVTVTNSTLSGNRADFGGGLFNGGKVAIIDSTLWNNTVLSFGGGIINLGQMTLTGSMVTENVARGNFGIGGGIVNWDGQVTITNSTFSGNLAEVGGGIANFSRGQATISGSTLSGNAANDGGGIYNYISCTLTLSNSTLSGNAANDDGGGIANVGQVTITNSTLSGNSAEGYGGGVYSRAQVTVRHSTITGNRADADGNNGGLGGGLFLYTRSTATLEHTIVAGNLRGAAPGGTPSDIEVGGGQVDPASSYNLIGDPNTAGGLVHGTGGNIVGDGNGGLLDINDVLDTTLSDNGGPTLTHALVEDSPAINAGDPSFAPPPDYDQRGAGYARVVGGRIDIGAFEFGAEFQPVVVGRYIFYDDSIFDGNVPGISGGDNDAIASDKSALLADSSLAGPANVTSYSRGINGIMVDIAGSHPDITGADFTFRMGSNNSPGSWVPAPEPAAVSVLAGQGLGGSDRVEIVWADGVIKNTYLQVIVAANDITGLAAPDVFFFGNRIGDTFTNTSPTTFITGAVDQIEVRGATPAFDLPVTSVLDFDKNGLLDANDQIVSRGNTGFLARIQISAPPAPLRHKNESSGSGSDLDAVAVALATPVGDGDAGTAQPGGVAPSAAAPATSAAHVDQALAACWSFLDEGHEEPPDDDDADELALILLGDDWR